VKYRPKRIRILSSSRYMVGIVFRRIEGIKTATSKAKKNPLLLPFFHCSDEKKKNPFFYSKFQTQIPSSIRTSVGM